MCPLHCSSELDCFHCYHGYHTVTVHLFQFPPSPQQQPPVVHLAPNSSAASNHLEAGHPANLQAGPVALTTVSRLPGVYSGPGVCKSIQVTGIMDYYSSTSLLRPPYLPRTWGHIREVAFYEGER